MHATRPSAEDLLRAVGYLAIFAWSVLFAVFPTNAYVNSLDTLTRLSWLGICGVGALVAFFGAVTRRDLKVELPGLLLMSFGPIFYHVAQVYYFLNPPATDSPNARIGLMIYSIVPFLLLLPRILELYRGTLRARRVQKNLAKGDVS